MRILTRYLLRSHVGPFLFALSVLTGLLLINTVARRFEELAGKGLPTSVILEVFALSLPHIVALTLPMAVLVAALYTFSQLAAENEITALKAGGINLVRLLLPLVAAATVLGGTMLWFNDRVLPESNNRLRGLLVDIGRKSPTLELKEQVINSIETGDGGTRYFLQAATIEPATNRLRDVVIYDLSTPGKERTIYADSGYVAFNGERTDLFFTLHDGVIHELEHSQTETFQRLFFDQQLIRMVGVGNQLERTVEETTRSDREMSIAMLAGSVERWRGERADVVREASEHVREAVEEVLQGRPDWDAAHPDAGGPRERTAGIDLRNATTRRTGSELRSFEARANTFASRINQYNVEIQKKYAIPFACIVFVLIGGPLAIRFPRGGVGMVIATSLTIFTFYYVGLISGESLSDKTIVTPFIAMWTPNIVFLGAAIWGLSRVGHEDGSARGGGWAELGGALIAVLTSPRNGWRRWRTRGSRRDAGRGARREAPPVRGEVAGGERPAEPYVGGDGAELAGSRKESEQHA